MLPIAIENCIKNTVDRSLENISKVNINGRMIKKEVYAKDLKESLKHLLVRVKTIKAENLHKQASAKKASINFKINKILEKKTKVPSLFNKLPTNKELTNNMNNILKKIKDNSTQASSDSEENLKNVKDKNKKKQEARELQEFIQLKKEVAKKPLAQILAKKKVSDRQKKATESFLKRFQKQKG